MEYLGQIRVEDKWGKDYGELPLFKGGGFINTEKGWSLYAQCCNTGDFKPFEDEKARCQGEEV